MVGHGGSSAGSYLADPTSPIPSHCASIVATSTLRINVSLHAIFILRNGFGYCNKLSRGKTDTADILKCYAYDL